MKLKYSYLVAAMVCYITLFLLASKFLLLFLLFFLLLPKYLLKNYLEVFENLHSFKKNLKISLMLNINKAL